MPQTSRMPQTRPSDRRRPRHRREDLRAIGLLALVAPLIPTAPALALEEVVIELPLLKTQLTVKLRELKSAEALRQGNSDLAELDRASNGAVGRQVIELMRQPVPLSVKQVADGSMGSPLVEQAMLVLSSIGFVEGRSADLSGRTLTEALRQAASDGEPTLLSLLKAVPGQRLTLDLGRTRQLFNRMLRQRQQAESLLAVTPAVSPPVSPPLSPPLAPAVSAASTARAEAGRNVNRRIVTLPVPHRPDPLEITLLEPASGANGRLVLISHGLWDSPAAFEGWGILLASRGYNVALPRHPGSDSSQQEAVLTGQSPPPGPEELARRPKDLIAVLDAIGNGRLRLAQQVDAGRVVVLGHSWGATTALQLAGLQPSKETLLQRCSDLDDPDRNLSWTLQCSWLRGVRYAGLADPRVVAVGAVSPPMSLLFARGFTSEQGGRVLLVSGNRDWVVPPDPEAIAPMRWGRAIGNQLVLVQGGDHFNLRPQGAADGGVLGPLLFAWTEAAFAAGTAVRPAPGAAPLLPAQGWGNGDLPMADVTGRLGNP
jgi:predicted dienelactone hydrolase